MRETRPSGSEGGAAQANAPSLPLSNPSKWKLNVGRAILPANFFKGRPAPIFRCRRPSCNYDVARTILRPAGAHFSGFV